MPLSAGHDHFPAHPVHFGLTAVTQELPFLLVGPHADVAIASQTSKRQAHSSVVTLLGVQLGIRVFISLVS